MRKSCSSKSVVEMEYMRISRERLAVLIGKEGETKKEIEDRLGVTIDIDTEDGSIRMENVGDDVLATWKARDIIKAIGAGLNPAKAMKLISDDYVLEIIDIEDIVGRSRKAVMRQKARIIGTKGKARKTIEECTGAYISVSRKRVAIVGTPERVNAAREAIIMITKGMPHGVVYKVLQKNARDLKMKEFSLWK